MYRLQTTIITQFFLQAQRNSKHILIQKRHTLFLILVMSVKKNVVRVPTVADNLYSANYCAFKNVGFGDKWFYGFITNVEYINNEVSAVSIDVDWMQTFLFDFALGNCYTVREHVVDDTIGAHTIPEDITFGENVVMKTMTHYFTDWKCIIVAIPNTSSTEAGKVNGK